MFPHKSQPLIIPQYEHGKLAGHLAQHWGNEVFERPPVDFQAFVAGVALHDWGYGVLDNTPVMTAAETDWLAIMRRGVAHRFPDPVTDIMTKLHMRRLLLSQPSPGRAQLVEQIDQLVETRLPEAGLTLGQCRWIDRITRLCDTMALDFCFGNPGERRLPLCPRWDSEDTIAVGYEIGAAGTISVSPWPFGVLTISGFVIAYQRRGYPDRLDPQLLPYRVVPG